MVGLSFAYNLNWKLHISSLAKRGVRRSEASLPVFLTLLTTNSVQGCLICLICPCMEYPSHVWGGSTHTVLLDRIKSKVFHLITPLLWLTVSSFFVTAGMLHLLPSCGKYWQEVLCLPNMAICPLRPSQQMQNLVCFGSPDQTNQDKLNPS